MAKGSIPIALTIAGSDSGGGAGIQADLKSFSANQAYGASVITALTAQNTLGVSGIHEVPLDFIAAQMDAVFSDLDVQAVKIGMLATSGIIATVAEGLKKWKASNIVLDPVMVTTSGDPLLAEDAVDALKTELLPLATLLTPNLHEAARLTGSNLANTRADMIEQGRAILAMGANAALIKGGHAIVDGETESADVLLTSGNEYWFTAVRIHTRNTHGTGCSLSSAIAANLAGGMRLTDAVSNAKLWLTGAIAASGKLVVGKGPGPVHHFYDLWPDA